MKDNEKNCNNCRHYDPETCICLCDGYGRFPMENACEKWIDWEEGDER